MNRNFKIDYEMNLLVFDDFVKNSPFNSHFMQSSAWGEFSETKGYQSHYIGLYEDNKLIATSLCLVKKLALNKQYMYITKGFVINYQDLEAIKYFNTKIIDYAKQLDCFYVKIDPNIILSELDEEAFRISEKQNTHFVDLFEEIGYHHLGYTKNFETTQPRYTFNVVLDDEFEKRIHKGYMKNVRKSDNYDVEVVEGHLEDVSYLHNLITLTGQRDKFSAYSLNYYKNFYQILSKYGLPKLYLGVVYPDRIIDKHEKNLEMYKSSLQELQELAKPTKKQVARISDYQKRIAKIEKELEVFKDYQNQFSDGIVTSAHMVLNYGRTTWALYAGSHNLFNETFINNRVYFEKLKDAKARGSLILDQFGTTGDLNKDNPLLGIHKFKKQFGGTYAEYIGEFDYVINKFWYNLYIKHAPKLRKLLRRNSSVEKKVTLEQLKYLKEKQDD